MPLAAIDLDGTLVRADGSVSSRSVDAIRTAHAAGWHIVLASGRPTFMIDPVADVLGDAVRFYVAVNGAMIIERPDTLLHLHAFDHDETLDAIGRLRVALPGIGFAMATDAGFAHEVGFSERMPLPPGGPTIADVVELGGNHTFKLMAFRDGATVAQLIDDVERVLGGSFVAQHVGADAIEIGPAGIDKAAGVRWLVEHLGIRAAEVVAFGDNWNDITMLQWAGHGVAMDNADEFTKASADEIAPHYEADGVAVVLERLISERR